jgi:hypothetical protein
MIDIIESIRDIGSCRYKVREKVERIGDNMTEDMKTLYLMRKNKIL